MSNMFNMVNMCFMKGKWSDPYRSKVVRAMMSSWMERPRSVK